MQDPDIHRKRRVVLRAIADLAVECSLPMPMSIDFHGARALNVRLDDNDRNGVGAWTLALALRVTPEEAIGGGKSGSRRFYDVSSTGTWLDADLRVWAACDTSEAGEPA